MLYQEHNSIGHRFFECIHYDNFEFGPHIHRHPELVHALQGTLVVETEGRREDIAEGGYALLLSNRVHAYHSEVPTSVEVCIFSEDYVPAFAKEVRGKRVQRVGFTCRPHVTAFANEELFIRDRQPDPYQLKAALYAVLGEFLAQVPLEREAGGGDEALIDRILRYVAQNYRENISLAGMAKELGYEAHYLSRYFHSRIPMHFSRFVNYYRVSMATELLNDTELSITDVAMQSGFQSIRSFNRVYREMTGHTPRAGAGLQGSVSIVENDKK